MARPDVIIGERQFKPKELGVIGGIKANLKYGVLTLLSDAMYPYHPQYQRVVDSVRLNLFYGKEAESAFNEIIDDAGRVSFRFRMAYELGQMGQSGEKVNVVLDALKDVKLPLNPRDLARATPFYRWLEDDRQQILEPSPSI